MENQIQTTNSPEQKYGKTLFSWIFPEFIVYQRSKLWYIIAGLIVVALLAYCVITANFLFAIIVVMTAAMWLFQSRNKPEEIEFAITQNGVRIGNNFYRYGNFKKFWIIYNPPTAKVLYLDFKNIVKPTTSIDLQDQNPLQIREALLQFLEEDLEKEDEPPIDTWRKLLKL